MPSTNTHPQNLLPRAKFLRLAAALAMTAATVRLPVIDELSAEPPVKDLLPDRKKLALAIRQIEGFGDQHDIADSAAFFRPGMELSTFTEEFKDKWRPVLGDGGTSLYTPTWNLETALKVLPGIDAWLAFALSLIFLLREEIAKTNPVAPILAEDLKRLAEAAKDIAKALETAAPYLGIRVDVKGEIFNSARIKIVDAVSQLDGDALFNGEIWFFDAVGFALRLRKFATEISSGTVSELLGWIDNAEYQVEHTRGALRGIFGQIRILQVADEAAKLLPKSEERLSTEGHVAAGQARLRAKGLLALTLAETAVLRVRSAGLRAATGVLTSSGRQALQMEVSAMIGCMRTLERIKFAGRPIYHQKSRGPDAEKTAALPAPFSLPNTVDLNLERNDGAILTVSTQEFGPWAAANCDKALNQIREHRRKIMEALR